MTPAATVAHRSAGTAPLRRPVAPRGPRRVSGPARRGAAPTLAPPLGARLLRGGGQLVDHRLLDRLIRGRAWIALVTFALLSIVTMQVALLKLNTGIGRSIERAASLQQQNTALEAQISTLASGDRITSTASSAGMVYPPAGDVAYLHATPADSLRAVRALNAGLAQPLVALGAQTAGWVSAAPTATPSAGATATTSALATTSAPASTSGAATSNASGTAATGTAASPTTTTGASATGTSATGGQAASATPTATAGSQAGGGTATGGAGAAALPGSTGGR